MNGLLLAVTIVSVITAVVSSAIAWRVTREERRRSNLRVAALSEAIYEDDRTRPSPAPTKLFEDPAPARTESYRAVAAIVACVVLLGTGMTFVTARSARRPAPAAATSATIADVPPLELLALEHDREGDRLIVRGLVRNPVNGGERRGLSAFVLLYRSDGRFLASGAAPVPLAALAPGETTPFVVNVSGADDVERFRLSFRTNARVEPHVDRRVHLPGEGVTQ